MGRNLLVSTVRAIHADDAQRPALFDSVEAARKRRLSVTYFILDASDEDRATCILRVELSDLVRTIDRLSGRSIGAYIAASPLHRNGRAYVAANRDGDWSRTYGKRGGFHVRRGDKLVPAGKLVSTMTAMLDQSSYPV